MTVGDLLDHFLPEMTTGKKPKGVKSYENHAAFWRKALGGEVAADLQPGEVERWKAKMLTDWAPATVNRSLTFLRRLFSLATRDQKVLVNPLAQGRVRQMRENNRRERFFSEEEEKLIRQSTPPKFWNMILLALHTGLRRGEQLQIRRDDIHLKRKQLRLEDTKAGEAQFVRLNSIAVEILQEVLASHDSPWVYPGKNGPLDGSAVSRRFQRLLEKINVKEASWHTLRHTYISRLAMLGTPLPTLQELARHKSIQMTLRYAHLCPAHAEQNLEDLARRYGPRVEPDPGQPDAGD
ncbi:site-specific integrase [bacterium]|nr:site-specific integrase [bacterium]